MYITTVYKAVFDTEKKGNYNMKKLALSLIMLFAVAGAMFAQNDLQVLSVVKYNKSESITVKQLKNRCAVYEKQYGRKLTLDEKKTVLKSLKEEKLVIQAATKAGLSIPDSTIDQYFLQTMQASVGAPVTEKELNELFQKSQGKTLDQVLLDQVGMNIVDYKAYLKSQLIAQQYIVKQKEKDIAAVAATDAEIRQFYEANKTTFVWNDMLKVFIVIVPKGSNPESAKTKANDLKAKYDAKKLTVKDLVDQSNKDGSGFQAGELLVPKRQEYAQTLLMSFENLQALFSVEDGFTCDVNETTDDYRFLTVQKKYNAKMLSLSDIIQPETTTTVYDYIKANLTQQKQMQYLQVAALEVAESLNKPEYVDDKKTGDALDKLLSWGD